MKKIAVTGASGFVGGVLCHRARRQGHEVKALMSRPSPLNRYTPDLEHIDGRLGDTEALSQLLEGSEVLVHSAARIRLDYGVDEEVEEINYHLSKQLFELAVKSGVEHIIFISSVQVYESNGGEEINESSPLMKDRRVSYNYSKALAQEALEKLGRESGIGYTILNPTAVIGAHNFEFGSAGQIFYMQEKGALPMIPQSGYNFVDVEDLAEIILRSAAAPASNTCYIVGGHFASLREVTGSYARMAQRKPPRYEVSIKTLRRLLPVIQLWEKISGQATGMSPYALDALERAQIPVNTVKYQEYFQFTPTPLENTLKNIMNWQKQYLYER